MKARLPFAFLFATILAASSLVQAGDVISKNPYPVDPAPFDPFAEGTRECQVLVGPFFSPEADNKVRDVILTGRHGVMLNSPSGSGIFRGNTEFLVDVFGGPIYEGAGDVFLGFTLLLRRNFVQPGSSIVPYVQVGGGGVYSDAASDDPVQRELGSEALFNLQAGVGLRWFVTERCAVTLEGTFRHFSNAGLADRNFGLNSVGGQIGVSIFF